MGDGIFLLIPILFPIVAGLVVFELTIELRGKFMLVLCWYSMQSLFF